MTKGVYRYFVDCGRMGEIEGTFSSTSEDVASLIGKSIYIDEPLGKHSSVSGTIEEDEITLVTDDPVAVEIFEKFDFASGYNPFNYILEDE